MITKFQVGDQVQLKTGEIGTIKTIEMVLEEGNSLYLVHVEDQDLMYSESLLTLYKEKEGNKKSYKDKTSERIIKELSLVNNPNEEESMKNACLLHKYLLLQEVDKLVDAKELDFQDNIEFQGLLRDKEEYIKNSYIFSHILSQLGMVVLNVGLKDEDHNFYMANLVLLGDLFYYFDVTLEKEIYKEDPQENFVLCCAALGKKIYEKYFTPVCILSFDGNKERALIPKNIAEDDFDIERINQMIGLL